MENKYRRKKEPEENRQLILKAAISIITEYGLEKLSIGEVAKKANMTKGGVVHHFPKKESLLDEVFKGRMEQFNQLFDQEIQKGNNSRAVAYLLAAFKYEPVDEHQILLKVLFQAMLQHHKYREMYKHWYTENVIFGLDADNATDLTAILLADGLLMAYLTGTFTLSERQKEHITNFLLKDIH